MSLLVPVAKKMPKEKLAEARITVDDMETWPIKRTPTGLRCMGHREKGGGNGDRPT